MKRLLWHWLISAAALWLTAMALHNGVTINPWWHVLWLAPLLGLVNVLVGAVANILAWIAFPVNLLTLGCFGFVLSFVGYALAINYLGKNLAVFHVASFSWAAALAIIMALFSTVLNMVLPGGRAGRRR
ncbi:MAG TPA: phage holin family protein [Armatimonadota bacterium]|jgi:uncharacterized membrane protein YvlD (DUF360 family)